MPGIPFYFTFQSHNLHSQGSSLWLLPPPSSLIEKSLLNLTTNIIPSSLPHVKKFPLLLPHLTLTSGIPDSVTDDEGMARQEWFESLPISLTRPSIVRFQTLDIGARVTKKLTLRVAKEGSLVDLAIQLRVMAVEGGSRKAAEEWAKTTWAPHVSLLYADTNIEEDERLEAMKAVKDNGIHLEKNGEEPTEPTYAGWEGGKILWVDTRGEIGGWTILGKRDVKVRGI